MFSLKRTLIAALAAATLAAGQPALTMIQDTLYRADGTRFSGTVFFTYNSFQAGDTSNIATSNLTLQIVNGALKVNLVPTTTATPGAQYTVKYNSKGINQFTEIWAVPPSQFTLRVRDVRVSQGTVIGPAAVTTPIQIGDVTGLQNELAVRPMRGVGFAVGRAAVINQAAQIDGAAGTPSDCLRVDGSSGPCGAGGGVGVAFADSEPPTGPINGTNNIFMLNFTPSPPSSLDLYRNGVRLTSGSDYLLSIKTITFFQASLPNTGDLLAASYRYANPDDPATSLAAPQVVCSSIGGGTASTVASDLGTCTISAGTLHIGDRIEVQFQYEHVGTVSGFNGEVRIGTTSAFSRDVTAAETLLVGTVGFAIGLSKQIFSTQSFGTSLAQTVSAGTTSELVGNDLTFHFKGHMLAAGADTVNLRTFTVIRYPAQSNP